MYLRGKLHFLVMNLSFLVEILLWNLVLENSVTFLTVLNWSATKYYIILLMNINPDLVLNVIVIACLRRMYPDGVTCMSTVVSVKDSNSYVLIITCTDNGQKYSHASNLPYIFHIKLQFFKILSWNQFTSDFNHYFIKESRKIPYVVYSSNFEITFWSMFFKSPWFKHRHK